MKTTLELPDALLRRAKIAAAQMDTTLKDLMTRALERELAGLPGRGAVVTDPLVSQLREEQGI
jgi:hypothetical protein